MSKVVGIVAEYNPFHNGHLYHVLETKRKTGADYVVCIMSGEFTQRGDVSIVNKWKKTEMALLNEVDLVIELPVIYSLSSAENFARGAVKILNELKVVDEISFGAETEDYEALERMAKILIHEPTKYKTILMHELEKGISYPKARERALLMYLGEPQRYAQILSSPNNILAIEYLKALRSTKSKIKPCLIKRKNVDYHELNIKENFASATAIRKVVQQGDFAALKKVMPLNSFNILYDEYKKGYVNKGITVFEKQILYNLRKMDLNEIADLAEVGEGLENRIKKVANMSNNYLDFMNMIKSKRYTQTRLQRILVYALLGITKKDMYIAAKSTPYIRVLGFNSKGKELLSEIFDENPKIDLFTSVKKFIDANQNKNLNEMIQKEIFATDVYTLGYENNMGAKLDYTNEIIKME